MTRYNLLGTLWWAWGNHSIKWPVFKNFHVYVYVCDGKVTKREWDCLRKWFGKWFKKWFRYWFEKMVLGLIWGIWTIIFFNLKMLNFTSYMATKYCLGTPFGVSKHI